MHKLETEIQKELEGFKGRLGLAVEIGGGQLFINSEEVFSSASIIKIPILIEGLRQGECGLINLEQLVRISNRAGGSGVLQALSDAASMTVQDLLTLMITVSDNTATNLLIDLLGMDKINACLSNLGLQYTVLNRKMMDLESLERGVDNVTSPLDMLVCLKIIHEGSFLSEKSRKLAMEIMHFQQFHDKLSAQLDLDRVFVASKTGGLPTVEHDCAIMNYRGKTAYVAALSDRLDDTYAAKQVLSRIGRHIYDFLAADSENI